MSNTFIPDGKSRHNPTSPERFCDECLEKNALQSDTIPVGELYAAYCDFCERNRGAAVKMDDFIYPVCEYMEAELRCRVKAGVPSMAFAGVMLRHDEETDAGLRELRRIANAPRDDPQRRAMLAHLRGETPKKKGKPRADWSRRTGEDAGDCPAVTPATSTVCRGCRGLSTSSEREKDRVALQALLPQQRPVRMASFAPVALFPPR